MSTRKYRIREWNDMVEQYGVDEDGDVVPELLPSCFWRSKKHICGIEFEHDFLEKNCVGLCGMLIYKWMTKEVHEEKDIIRQDNHTFGSFSDYVTSNFTVTTVPNDDKIEKLTLKNQQLEELIENIHHLAYRKALCGVDVVNMINDFREEFKDE